MLHATLAYIDPGTGTLVLQMLIAGIVGALAFFRGAIMKFFGFFRSSKKDETRRD